MPIFNRRHLLWFLTVNFSFYLFVQSGLIQQPVLNDDELSSLVELNNEMNSNRYDPSHRSIFLPLPPAFYDDYRLQQIISHHQNTKRSKLNLHTNLNLPRYLRSI